MLNDQEAIFDKLEPHNQQPAAQTIDETINENMSFHVAESRAGYQLPGRCYLELRRTHQTNRKVAMSFALRQCIQPRIGNAPHVSFQLKDLNSAINRKSLTSLRCQ